MKKSLLLTLSMLCSFIVFSQTEKGDWLVGGTLELNTAENNTTVTFSPNAGYFFMNNFAGGAQLNFSYTELGQVKATIFGIGPFVRYYFLQNKVRPFVAGDWSFESRKLKTNLGESTETGSSFFLGGGCAFFINENVALEGLMGYKRTKVENNDGQGGFNFKFGFQVYINRGQVSRLTNR